MTASRIQTLLFKQIPGAFLNSPLVTLYLAIQNIAGRFRRLYYRIYFAATGKAPLPSFILVDPANVCNLRCPFCPTGNLKLDDEQNLMCLETFKMLVAKMPFVKNILMCNWGEPLLNPQLPEMIRFASSKKIKVRLDTHLSIERDDAFFSALLGSGIQMITVSLDGASQSTYEKYRVNGDFELVIRNIKKLAALKKQAGLKHPHIVWKYIVNQFNEPEIEKARDMAKSLGVYFLVTTMHLGDYSPDMSFDESTALRQAEWLPKNQQYVKTHYKRSQHFPIRETICHYLFSQPAVNPQGKLYPCCHVTKKENIFGDLAQSSFEEIWNNEKYTASRSLFAGRHQRETGLKTICDSCELFKKQNSTPIHA